MASKDAGFLPPVGVGGWIVFVTSRFVFTSELLKPELAIGFPLESKAVEFLLRACAIRSELSHQSWARPASIWTPPKCRGGFTRPPNIHPSSVLALCATVHGRPFSVRWSRVRRGRRGVEPFVPAAHVREQGGAAEPVG